MVKWYLYCVQVMTQMVCEQGLVLGRKGCPSQTSNLTHKHPYTKAAYTRAPSVFYPTPRAPGHMCMEETNTSGLLPQPKSSHFNVATIKNACPCADQTEVLLLFLLLSQEETHLQGMLLLQTPLHVLQSQCSPLGLLCLFARKNT